MDQLADQIAERIRNDARLQTIHLDIELGQSRLIPIVLQALSDDKDQALITIANCAPTDAAQVAEAQVRIRAYLYLIQMFQSLRENARLAEQAIAEEEKAIRQHEAFARE